MKRHPNFTNVEIIRTNPIASRWLNLFKASYETINNKSGVWEFVSRNQNPQLTPHIAAVVIVAFVKNGDQYKLLLSSEFRIPIGCREFGFCAGLIDHDETPEFTAQRELREESGLLVTRYVKTSPAIVSSAGLSDESVHMVFVEAKGELDHKEQEKMEDIETYLIGNDEIKELVNGKFRGNKVTIAAKAWPVLHMISVLLECNLTFEEIIEKI